MAAPKGNKNAANARTFKDALNWALDHFENSAIKRGQALRAICSELVKKAAADGNLQAIQEVASRLDGKPGQSLTVNGKLDFVDVLAQFAIARAKHVATDSQTDAPIPVDKSDQAAGQQVKH